MIIFYTITYLLTLIPLCNGFSSCSTSSIGFCLRSLFDVWEHVRNIESHAANLLFPVPFYTKQSVLVLCNDYIETKAKCFVDGELGCRQSSMVSFVRSHLDFYCGTHLPIYIENFECISSNLLRNRQCFQTIFGIPNPMNDKDKCNGLPKYFDCVKESLNSSCGAVSTALVGSSIKSFGCQLEDDALDLTALKKVNESGKYTQQYLEDFVLLERPANLDDLRKSKEISSETTRNDSSTVVAPSVASSVTSLPTTSEEVQTKAETTTTISSSSSAPTTITQMEISTESTFATSTEDFDDSFNTLNDLSDDQPFAFSASMLEEKTITPSLETNNSTEESINQTSEIQNNSTEPSVAFSETLILTNSSLSISNTTTNTQEEITLTTESTTITTTTTPLDDSEICTPAKEQNINSCYENVVNDLSRLASQGEPSTQIRFPLFNISLPGVLSMCKLYDEATKCASQHVQPCYDMQILQFLSGQLENVCFRINSMKAEYQCMLNSFNENPNCLRFLASNNNQTKCDYQQEAFDCLQSSIICLEQKQTIILIKEMIRGYGCTVYFKHYLTKPPITLAPTTRRTRRTTTPASTTISSDDVEGSGESSDSQPTTNTISSTDESEEDISPTTESTIRTEATQAIETTTLTTTNIPTTLSIVEQFEEDSLKKNELADAADTSPACPKAELNQVRECMAPLMSTWLRIHSKKPLLSEITFPVYSYTPREMLDLCDGYANLFLCAGVTQIKRCLKDEMLEAAQDYLGYQCSPPNLPTFMKYYSCIKSVDSSFGCSRFIRGTVTTARKRKCDGFSLYVNCMVPLVQSTCGLDAIRQFNFTVSQFGCNRRQE